MAKLRNSVEHLPSLSDPIFWEGNYDEKLKRALEWDGVVQYVSTPSPTFSPPTSPLSPTSSLTHFPTRPLPDSPTSSLYVFQVVWADNASAE